MPSPPRAPPGEASEISYGQAEHAILFTYQRYHEEHLEKDSAWRALHGRDPLDQGSKPIQALLYAREREREYHSKAVDGIRKRRGAALRGTEDDL